MRVTMDMKWSDLLHKKEKNIMKNSELENAKRINCQYEVGDFIKINMMQIVI